MEGRLSCLTMHRNFHRRNLRFKHGTILPLMLCLLSQPNISRRATAWLLLLVCAWMGTGGVLHHTEAEGASRPVSQVASRLLPAALHHLTAVPHDTCAACEWTQGLLGRTLSFSPISFLLSPLPSRPRPALPALIARATPRRSSRAPPASSAFC